jgi:hypothetical protein
MMDERGSSGMERKGLPLCLPLARIFGATNYMVVDQINALPEKVLHIYAGLTR